MPNTPLNPDWFRTVDVDKVRAELFAQITESLPFHDEKSLYSRLAKIPAFLEGALANPERAFTPETPSQPYRFSTITDSTGVTFATLTEARAYFHSPIAWTGQRPRVVHTNEVGEETLIATSYTEQTIVTAEAAAAASPPFCTLPEGRNKLGPMLFKADSLFDASSLNVTADGPDDLFVLTNTAARQFIDAVLDDTARTVGDDAVLLDFVAALMEHLADQDTFEAFLLSYITGKVDLPVATGDDLFRVVRDDDEQFLGVITGSMVRDTNAVDDPITRVELVTSDTTKLLSQLTGDDVHTSDVLRVSFPRT